MALELIPRILFDTAVFIDAANGVLEKGAPTTRIPPSDWNRAVAHVDRNFVHAISPYTVAELLTGIANADPNCFSQNKVALRKLRSSFRSHVHLPYTKYFTLREVFGLPAPYPDNLEDNFDSKMDIVLDATSLNYLTQIRFFDSFLSGRRYQANCSRIRAERIQADGLKLTRNKWASDMLVPLELADTTENLSLLNLRLDACFYWDELCHLKARNTKCDLEKVIKMQYDLSQLNFLAAQDLVFVTRDSALVKAIAKSNQANRVMLWNDFLRTFKK